VGKGKVPGTLGFEKPKSTIHDLHLARGGKIHAVLKLAKGKEKKDKDMEFVSRKSCLFRFGTSGSQKRGGRKRDQMKTHCTGAGIMLGEK